MPKPYTYILRTSEYEYPVSNESPNDGFVVLLKNDSALPGSMVIGGHGGQSVDGIGYGLGPIHDPCPRSLTKSIGHHAVRHHAELLSAIDRVAPSHTCGPRRARTVASPQFVHHFRHHPSAHREDRGTTEPSLPRPYHPSQTIRLCHGGRGRYRNERCIKK